MNNTPVSVCLFTLLACFAAAPAPAETLVSPPIAGGNDIFCNVVNVSSVNVTLNRFELHAAPTGAITATTGPNCQRSTAGGGVVMAPGAVCSIRQVISPGIGAFNFGRYCLVEHSGAEGAIFGSAQTLFRASPGVELLGVTSLPMQVVQPGL